MVPLSTTPYGFYIIVGIILVICIGVLWFLKKKKNDVKIYRNIISIFYVRFIQ